MARWASKDRIYDNPRFHRTRNLRENDNDDDDDLLKEEANMTEAESSMNVVTNDIDDESILVPPSRIIFGSCNSQYYEQPLWKVIQERNPTAFVWAGDSVYGDDHKIEPWSNSDNDNDNDNDDDKYKEQQQQQANRNWWKRNSSAKNISYATPEYLAEKFANQLEVEGYKELVQNENISIFGTIDDHDFGINNGDRTFPFKKGNAIEYIKFLGLNEDSSTMARRANKGRGVYGVQVYDFSSPQGQRLLSDDEAGLDPDVVKDKNVPEFPEQNKLVAVFVLDVRNNKTPWKKKQTERYEKDPEGDFLGDDQWEWFETAIGRSKASVNIVVTGVQAHAPWFFDSNKVENWR